MFLFLLGLCLPVCQNRVHFASDFRRFTMKVSAAIAEALVEIGEQFAVHFPSNDMFSGERISAYCTAIADRTDLASVFLHRQLVVRSFCQSFDRKHKCFFHF